MKHSSTSATRSRSIHFLLGKMRQGITSSFFKSMFIHAGLILFFVLSYSNEAFATHFRYGNISWRKIDPLTVEFKLTIAERRSYEGSPNVGDIVTPVNFNFGDGSNMTPNLTITAQNNVEDWIFAEATFTHTYPSSAVYTAGTFNCCRLSSLAIGADGDFNLSTAIDLTSSNRSPISAFSPIVCVAAGIEGNTFTVSAFDPDGDPLTYSLNSTTSGIPSYPSGLSVNNAGLVTFNTVGIAGVSEYPVQVVISDGHTSIPVDFIIRVVASTSAAPVFDYTVTPANGSAITATVGTPLAINLKALDPDVSDIVSLSLVGQPAGTTFSTALPALGNPSMTTLNWTPTAADMGATFVVNVIASSGTCESAVSSFTITVGGSSCTPPTLDFAAYAPSCQYGSNGSVFMTTTGGSGVQTYSWAGNGFTANTQNLFNVSSGTYYVTVTDACGTATGIVNVPAGRIFMHCPSTIGIECNQLTSTGKALPSVTGELNIVRDCFSPDSISYSDTNFDFACGATAPPSDYPLSYGFNEYFTSQAKRIIVRTFTASYRNSGSTYYCNQLIYVRGNRLTDVVFPSNVALTCSNTRTEPTNALIAGVVVSGTGTPNLLCSNLGQTFANSFQTTYTDIRTNLPNSTGFTIERTWVVNNCLGETRTYVQTITAPNCTATSMAGGIKREDGATIPTTTLLYNAANALVDSTTGGTYSFRNLTYNNRFRVMPTRPNTDWTNGVTMLDVSLLSRHILGITPLASPYSIIGGDVNRDGAVDALDMLIMQRLILRIIPSVTNNNSWRFVMKNHTFANPRDPFASDFPEILVVPNLTAAITNGDFVAIKVGDINQSAGSLTIRGGAKPFNLFAEDKVLEKGQTYQIPIQMTPSVSALQFTLNIDKTAAQIEGITKGDLPNFNENNTGLFAKEGIVTAAWHRFANQSLSETEALTLMIVTIKPTTTTRLSQILSINSLYTEGVAYDAKGEGMPVQLSFGHKTVVPEKAVLLPNRPNPYRDETTLSFVLPEAGVAKLTVCDLLGKVLMTTEKTFSKGINEVLFSAQETPSVSSGIFIVRLQTATGMAEQKIVLSR